MWWYAFNLVWAVTFFVQIIIVFQLEVSIETGTYLTVRNSKVMEFGSWFWTLISQRRIRFLGKSRLAVLVSKFKVDYSQLISNFVCKFFTNRTWFSNFNALAASYFFKIWRFSSVCMILQKFFYTLTFSSDVKQFSTWTIIEIVFTVIGQTTLLFFNQRICIWSIWSLRFINLSVIMIQ